ncbi:hypothetical protein BT93_K0490 [Corymbia citriodora subsp. variegata]|nr:hypothetical protein BT93_K0490 [Corymbia citriodora subsp. variegata]
MDNDEEEEARKMEDRSVAVEDAEPEQISESFTCCICLELLYKPIVIACGHISCFWCVHQSMNGFREARCPLCRQPYLHFPSICLLLHFLLLKMYPDTYRRREMLTLEEEKRKEIFSPQFDALAWRSGDEEQQRLSGSSQSHMTCLGPNSSLDTGSSRNGEPHASMVEAEPVAGVDGYSPSKCKQLLFRPVALNLYCESCIVYQADEKLTCQVCKSRHPRGLPKVCLELDHFLEQQFTEEYASRRFAARPRLTISENASQKSLGNSAADKELKNSPWLIDTSVTHLRVGCDYCGVTLNVKIPYDNCQDCYNSHRKLPGRFNQQHRPEHKFKLISFEDAEDSLSIDFVSEDDADSEHQNNSQ